MNKEQIVRMIDRYAADELTEEEVKQFFQWFEKADYDELIEMYNESQYSRERAEYQLTDAEVASFLDKLPAPNAVKVIPVRRYVLRYVAVAASVMLVILGVAWLISGNSGKESPVLAETVFPDVQPGTSGAVLTLSDGTTLVLDSLADGVITKQSGTSVLLNDGKLSYQADGVDKGSIQYNTISTPRGRQFQVELPDGTMVWLNAGSSLRYPTVFPDEERRVQISGEAYFDVKKNAGSPFRVVLHSGGDFQVEVLGTEFNINAYEDELQVQTTLVSGAVRAGNPATNVTMKPGQQAVLASDELSAKPLLREVNAQQVSAWKMGYFDFEEEELGVILRQLSRWYNVEFKAGAEILRLKFSAVIPRTSDIDHAVSLLSATGAVKFKKEGDRISVY